MAHPAPPSDPPLAASPATAVDTAADDGAPATSRLSVRLEDVGRTFDTPHGAHTVLRDVSLTIAPGEVLAILGASGSGKSTLLRSVGGLDTAHSGRVLLGESPVTAYDPRVAVGFQEPRLLPWRTIRRNIALGLPRGTSRAEGEARVERLMGLVGLTHAAERRPREVSGGMAQRASLARALARRPEVLLLDEPFGALDALTRMKMQDLLLDVHAKVPTTVLLVTHDVDEALQLADRILLLGPDEDGRPGATVQRLLTVPGERPRERGDDALAHLRTELFAGLGVDLHSAAGAGR